MCLPKNKIGMFLNNEQAIYAAIEAQQKEGLVIETLAEVKKTHTVRGGEKLSTIARKYGVTVADLKTWNYVGKKGIRPGKKLVVYVRESKPVARKLEVKPDENLASVEEKSNSQLAENSSKETSYIYHKVRKGETLFGVAKKYGADHKEIKSLNNLKSNELKYGQLLKIRN
jgi:membrane-bound lytic murein transglycosylase D